MTYFSIIVATDSKNGIGKNNKIPWHFAGELRYFKNITENGYVIMGRKTWESLPTKYRPLPTRINIIISSQNIDVARFKNVHVFPSLNDALFFISMIEENPRPNPNKKNVFVIGGEMLYNEAIMHDSCNKIFINTIDNDYECDRFFPVIDEDIWKISESFTATENNTNISYNVYTK